MSGDGALFKLVLQNGTWVEEVLHDFSGSPDGSNPQSNLLLDKAGVLWGTTLNGGTASGGGLGTVFQYNTKTKAYSVVYSFQGGADGSYPAGGLVQDAKGNFYGTTEAGGTGGGTVFMLDPTGRVKTVLYNFAGSPDGAYPSGPLTSDGLGNFYGTTSNGGSALSYGTVFMLAPPSQQGGAWTETVVYSFKGGTTDGYNPVGGVVLDASGNCYGVTTTGGSQASGTVYKVSCPGGTETVKWAFTGGADGGSPYAGLMIDAREKYVYGTTYSGGAYILGVVFRVAIP